jgi:hypothetical protein
MKNSKTINLIFPTSLENTGVDGVRVKIDDHGFGIMFMSGATWLHVDYYFS